MSWSVKEDETNKRQALSEAISLYKTIVENSEKFNQSSLDFDHKTIISTARDFYEFLKKG